MCREINLFIHQLNAWRLLSTYEQVFFQTNTQEFGARIYAWTERLNAGQSARVEKSFYLSYCHYLSNSAIETELLKLPELQNLKQESVVNSQFPVIGLEVRWYPALWREHGRSTWRVEN